MATILLIADEGPLSDRYRGWLADAHTVRVASTGERALATLDDEVDAALLERRLPDGTGRAVLERLRREGYRCRVALLADVEPEFDVVRAGFDECLERPVTRAVLSATIDRLCRRRRYDERVREYHTLVRERTALEKRLSDETLAASAEYEELNTRSRRSRRLSTTSSLPSTDRIPSHCSRISRRRCTDPTTRPGERTASQSRPLVQTAPSPS
ncbi:response regulator transcription factor [Halospeciosus flavus]|uniref:response regulator transcription factor n=1 Tax=Halospeciosus flavus TaxID=3032283 RepID=UPI003616CA2B